MLIGHGIERMSFGFGATMYGKVFNRCYGFIVGGVIPLKTFHKLNSQPAGEVRVFSVSFLSAAPAGVTKNIDVGRPQGKSLIDESLVTLCKIFMLRARFIGDSRGHRIEQRLIPCCSKPDGLRKNGG